MTELDDVKYVLLKKVFFTYWYITFVYLVFSHAWFKILSTKNIVISRMLQSL